MGAGGATVKGGPAPLNKPPGAAAPKSPERPDVRGGMRCEAALNIPSASLIACFLDTQWLIIEAMRCLQVILTAVCVLLALLACAPDVQWQVDTVAHASHPPRPNAYPPDPPVPAADGGRSESPN